MLITSYNPVALGDVLIMTTAQATASEQKAVRFGDLIQIQRRDNDQVVGYNLFNASKHLTALAGSGQVTLTEEQVAQINQLLSAAQQPATLKADRAPKFVIGHVLEMKAHPDSDHLQITQVDVGQEKPLQIVCGAPNIQAGQKVVVALVGAMMPSGKLIWPGKLRGVASFGMICSPRELALANAPARRGIMVLAHDAVVGQAFDFQGQYQFA
ncbi:YtpR family tRNA-binding protein [Lapidilactobacillus achengensis]|uniref:YtpR family tRNA-binding protein n=1 Tax=Lapidilactobacillus achengensis TaxID=2486000 RepID=A0ABW1UQC7_9LACO|nr:DUF4479 and tRNA-binding domain-containing protein [Lapidilactobacillus achengensis]